MTKLIHSMIRVEDDAASIKFYADAFGLFVAEQLDFESFRLTYLSNANGSFELELTLNKKQTEPYELGSGYGHLAVSVDDLDVAHARYQKLDIAVGDIVAFAPAGELIARFCFVTDPDGYKIEVIERGGRFK
ncbi:MAG: VOC family protein [Sulfitobacter sp.]